MATHQLAPSGSALILSPSVTLPPGFNSMAASSQGRSQVSAMGNTGSGSPRQQPLLSPRASSLQHVEVMERLKQLMAWQERQKASLLRQQQEQIMQLHQHHQSEQQPLQWQWDREIDSEGPWCERDSGGLPDRLQPEDEQSVLSLSPIKTADESDGSPRGAESPRSKKSPRSTESRGTMSPRDAKSSEGTREQLDPNQVVKERPLESGIGKNLASFEDLVEASLKKDRVDLVPDRSSAKKLTSKRPFLKRGEGIARFGLKSARVKFKKKSLQEQKVDQGQVMHLNRGKCLRSMSSPLLNSKQSSAGILAGQDGCEPRISTPLVRCSSEDSFIIRRDQRLKVESEELREFEMLEEAANMSFSSQLSLFNDPPKHLPSRRIVARKDHTNSRAKGASSVIPSRITENLVPQSAMKLSPVLTTYHPEPVSDDEQDKSEDLDETLKFSPSLAKGMEFNDEEAWESFSHDSPQSRHRTESSGSDTTLPHHSPYHRSEIWSSPVKKELLGRPAGFAVQHQAVPQRDVARTFKDSPRRENYITAIERSKVVAAPELHSSASSRPICSQVSEPAELGVHPHFHTTELSSRSSNSSSSSSDGIESAHSTLPPPSVLVSKLFPVLRRVEEQPNTKAHGISEGHMPLFKSPSPLSSTEGDSGIRSISSTSIALSEDLKYKLTQLEEEIARYRSENASLEKLRKEREEAVTHLRQEISEFKRQKGEEIARFEEYKKEELKKLKKERKIFEAYQQEAKAARDKKDKEDIETLRQELLEAQEDARHGEARWGATLSRYRIKIQSLEDENCELKEDLRMMEQERLRSWQLQVEQEVLAKKSSGDRKGHAQNDTSRVRKPKPVRKPNAAHSSFPSVRQSHPENKSRFSPPRRQGGATLQRSPLCESRVPQGNTPLESDSDASSVSDQVITTKADKENRRGYQSDSEDSISETAEEIVVKVVEEDRGTVVRKEKENTPVKPSAGRTDVDNPAAILRAWKSDHIKQTTGDAGGKRRAKKTKSVRFSVSPPPPTSSVSSSAPSIPHAPSSPSATTLPLPPMTASRKTSALQWKEVVPSSSKSEVIQPDGSKVITFSNGTRKVLSADGKSSSVYFFNGDVKHVKADQTVVYYYCEYKVTQTNYPDGLEVVDFPNKQCEKHYPNGTKEIRFPNDTVKYIYSNGEEESVFPDGLSQRNYPNGDVTLRLPNGIKEYYTSEFKRREYPDGTVKTVYPDGKQETHYASGRTKIKDKNGRIITDT